MVRIGTRKISICLYSAFHTHVKLRLGLIFDSNILLHGFLQGYSQAIFHLLLRWQYKTRTYFPELTAVESKYFFGQSEFKVIFK